MMTKAVFVLAVLLMTPAWGQPLDVVTPESVGLAIERLARIDETFGHLVDQGQIAGVSLLIARRGQVAYRRDLGFMDVENRIPMSPDAIFRIASMTKALTAVAVLQLFEQGRFMLDDPATNFIPALKTMRVMDSNQTGTDPNHPRTRTLERDITIRDLLRHTAGIYGGSRYTRAGLRKWSGSLASNGTIYWAGGPHNTYYFVDFQEQMCGIFFMQTEPWNHLDLMRRFLVLSHQAIAK